MEVEVSNTEDSVVAAAGANKLAEVDAEAALSDVMEEDKNEEDAVDATEWSTEMLSSTLKRSGDSAPYGREEVENPSCEEEEEEVVGDANGKDNDVGTEIVCDREMDAIEGKVDKAAVEFV